jgi:hypothetical protein
MAERLDRILARLAAGSVRPTSRRLCAVAADVTGMSGAGILLVAGDADRASLCRSDHVSGLMEDLEYTLGEGPCIDADRTGMAVLEPDLASPAVPRWQGFAPSAVEAGARAIFGFPVRIGAARLGALNLYRDRPGPLSEDQYATGLVMADVTAAPFLPCKPPPRPARSAPKWRWALTSTRSSTKRPVWYRSSSASVSPKPWSDYEPGPSRPTSRSRRSPRLWSGDNCGSAMVGMDDMIRTAVMGRRTGAPWPCGQTIVAPPASLDRLVL